MYDMTLNFASFAQNRIPFSLSPLSSSSNTSDLPFSNTPTPSSSSPRSWEGSSLSLDCIAVHRGRIWWMTYPRIWEREDQKSPNSLPSKEGGEFVAEEVWRMNDTFAKKVYPRQVSSPFFGDVTKKSIRTAHKIHHQWSIISSPWMEEIVVLDISWPMEWK